MAGKAYTRTYTGDINTCCICIDEFVQGDDCVRLDCRHILHSKCMSEYVAITLAKAGVDGNKTHPDCPHCRGPGNVIANYKYVGVNQFQVFHTPAGSVRSEHSQAQSVRAPSPMSPQAQGMPSSSSAGPSVPYDASYDLPRPSGLPRSNQSFRPQAAPSVQQSQAQHSDAMSDDEPLPGYGFFTGAVNRSRDGSPYGRFRNPLRHPASSATARQPPRQENDVASPHVSDAFSVTTPEADERSSSHNMLSHVSTRLPDGRYGLLIDPGALNNLVGSQWLRSVEKQALSNGFRTQECDLSRTFQVQGVGTGTIKTNVEVRLPIAVIDEHGVPKLQFYQAPIVNGPGKSLPALLGLNSMSRHRGVLEMTDGHEYLTFPGPGGYCIRWSEDTRRYKLVRAPSGHLILPCDEYARLRADSII